MKILSDILKDVDIVESRGELCSEISSLHLDSREVTAGGCFFAIRGEVVDGHTYISKAIELGAKAIICEQLPGDIESGVSYIVVTDSNLAMGLIATSFYDDPTKELTLVAITGTNGKTTTATLLYELFRKLGYKTGLISTVNYIVDEDVIPSTHTTPDAIRLNSMLRDMVSKGCQYAFMEISSHALVQHRTAGLKLAGAIFSNITHDHLDYHGTFAEYIKAKKSLFDSLPKSAFALINEDDKNGRVMVQNCSAKVSGYSLRSMADFRCKVQEMHLDGMLLNLGGYEVWVRLLGRFNAYNILALYSTSTLLGVDNQELLAAISSLGAVNGRFEHFTSNDGVTVIIDYAHTPDALAKCCQTVREILPSGEFYVVCGCGGERDRTKRPQMARISTEYASMSIFTSDNPRGESAQEIIEQMIQGVPVGSRYLSIVDRAEAIRSALMLAKSGDVVLIAGKGHENYQIIGKQKFPFSDKEVAMRVIKSVN
ncbi:MAG: UDP-N-acetylmuramoyl-L-alanyl-D-glutamate--2,6-diaminopimelate ligase [Rikenellaceae bacterium]